jgi:Transposase IS116/IS110/IS902 family
LDRSGFISLKSRTTGQYHALLISAAHSTGQAAAFEHLVTDQVRCPCDSYASAQRSNMGPANGEYGILKLARYDAQVRSFMTVPGIGPITALCFKATIDDPTRFKR